LFVPFLAKHLEVVRRPSIEEGFGFLQSVSRAYALSAEVIDGGKIHLVDIEESVCGASIQIACADDESRHFGSAMEPIPSVFDSIRHVSLLYLVLSAGFPIGCSAEIHQESVDAGMGFDDGAIPSERLMSIHFGQCLSACPPQLQFGFLVEFLAHDGEVIGKGVMDCPSRLVRDLPFSEPGQAVA
jgi:hypothetical protein